MGGKGWEIKVRVVSLPIDAQHVQRERCLGGIEMERPVEELVKLMRVKRRYGAEESARLPTRRTWVARATVSPHAPHDGCERGRRWSANQSVLAHHREAKG